MKFNFKRSDLLKGLIIIEKAIPERSFLNIITGILFSFEKNILVLETTDLEISIRTVIKGKGNENIKIVLPRNIINIIKSFSDENINIEIDKNNYSILIRRRDLEFNIQGFNAEEYPLFPAKPKIYSEIELSVFLFKQMIREVLFVVSRDKNKAVFNGVHFLIEEENINFTAADGFRLAILKGKISKNPKNNFNRQEAIIPSRALKEIGNILSDEENIKMVITDGQAFFEIKNSIFVTNILAEKYPDIVKFIPVNYSTQIVIDKKIMEKVIERAEALKTSPTHTLSLAITEKGIEVTTVSSLGSNSEKIKHKFFQGEEITIILNVVFLREIFKVISSEKVVISFNGKDAPCVIKSLNNEEYLYMVLPVISSENVTT